MNAGIKGIIVTAAFIGPGTITTASRAGAELGYQLVWAIVFSIFATCVLQLMARRLGQASGLGLSSAAMQINKNKVVKALIAVLIIVAIGIGNATYQSGNITGAALALSYVSGLTIAHWSLLIGAISIVLLITRKHKLVESVLVILVGFMSVVFIALMFIANTNWLEMFRGLSPVNTDFTKFDLVLALIGTTIVPYNLYLLSGMEANVQNKASDTNENREDWQLVASIGVGGLITLAILSSAASAFFAQGLSMDASNISQQLQPLLGDKAGIFFALGLFAAGITSAITAPLATGYAISGLFKWQASLANNRFLVISITVVVFGTALANLGLKPLSLIITAQITNALLLPVSVLIMLIACNNSNIMRGKANSPTLNLLGAFVFLLVFALSAYKLLS